MKLMPIVYVTDMVRSVEFYERLGLTSRTKDRSSTRFEMTMGDAILALHHADSLPELKDQRLELAFVSTEKLEEVVTALKANGLHPEGIVDEAFGRSFRIYDPDGLLIQVNEHDASLYR